VGVVTKPFQFEGSKRMKQADEGIKQLQKVVDTLIVIPNQNLFRLATEKTTFTEAFSMADDVLYQGVKGVTDLMVKPGLINLDFADVRSVMDEMGKAMMGTGEASGEERALQAAEKAIANPLLDEISLKGATGLLINVTGSSDMALFEVDEAANRIRDEVDPDANIIVGSTFDSELTGSIRVSVVATGIDVNEFSKKEEQDIEQKNSMLPENLSARSNQEAYFFDRKQKAEVDVSLTEEKSIFSSNSTRSPIDEKKDSDMSFLQSSSITLKEDDHTTTARPNRESISTSAKIDMPEKKSDTPQVSSVGGLNGLIRRMTGFKENKRSSDNLEKKNDLQQKSLQKSTERDDESKLDIPAFLRRQAN
jgi:cell division protein FtsZ